MTTTIIWTIAILTILGALLAVVLYVVAEKFKVEEDPRIDEVEKVLPGANCGGCGQAGCRAFAQFCVESSPNLDKCFCPVGGNDGMQKVAAVLGVEVAAKEPQVAVVRCNGTCENRPRINEYGGFQSCRVKAALYSGDTGCSFGCLGCGDCVAACQFGAISWILRQDFLLWTKRNVLPAVHVSRLVRRTSSKSATRDAGTCVSSSHA